jgi:hypothetical protein
MIFSILTLHFARVPQKLKDRLWLATLEGTAQAVRLTWLDAKSAIIASLNFGISSGFRDVTN